MITLNPIERFLSSVAITSLIVCGFFYIHNGRGKEEHEERLLSYGIASYFLSVGLIRIFLFFVELFVDGIYIVDFTQVFETYNATNYILLYFYLFLFSYVLIVTMVVIGVFIWISVKTKREIQTISSTISVGFAFILIGWLSDGFFIRRMEFIPQFIPSSFILLGSVLIIIPLLIDREIFSWKIANWLVISSIIGIGVFLVLGIFSQVAINVLSIIIITISSLILILVVLIIINQIIQQRRTQESEGKDEVESLVTVFTKPISISVDEIELSKEKGTCLVCKSKISGINYACPKCQVPYCYRCMQALGKMENSCWVCSTQFENVMQFKEEN